MRSAFKLFALIAGIAVGAVSCNKEIKAPQEVEPLKLVIRAGAPESKTAITYDGDKTYTPSWSANDAIGVYFTTVEEESTEFVNADAGDIALFAPSSEITSVSGNQTLYSFYPRSAFNAVKEGTSIRVNVKDMQTPDALGTFDKTTDILVARPYSGNITTINTEGGIIDLAFARILSIVKIIPSENATDIDNEYVKSIKIEYNGSGEDAPLTGRVVLDLNSGEFGDWTIKTYGASANYGESVFDLNGINAAYLLVNPISIASGKKVTFTVKTNKHDATKEFTLNSSLVFPAGNIARIDLSIDDSWTIEDNTLDPNIIFKAPFSAYSDGMNFISSNTSYDSSTHGDLGVVGTSKSSISYTFAGTNQLRNNTNKISDDDASFYWCTSTTGLTIQGINVGSNQYFNLSFDRKVPSSTATMAVSISEDGNDWFPITSSATIDITGTSAGNSSFNFSIPAGNRDNLRLKFENSGSGVSIDNVTLTKLDAAGDNNTEVSFVVVAVNPTLVVSPSPVDVVVGSTQQLSVSGTDGAVSYHSNNDAIATVSDSGLITAVATGSTTIDITTGATSHYNAGSTSVTVTVSAAPVPKTLPYNNTLISGHTDFTINNVSTGSLGSIWSDTAYGVQANANNTTSNVETYIESPLIDLTAVADAKLSFEHGIRYFADVATAQTQATLEVRVQNGAWNQVIIPTYPATQGNSAVSAEVSLNAYAGHVIQFRFKYLATSQNPGRWQIKNLSVEEVVPPATRTITITSPSGGTIAATVDDVAINSGDEVEEGKTVEITATPSSGYEFSEWSVTGATVGNATATSTSFTVGASDVTVAASFALESTANSYEYIFTSNSWAATREGNAENWTSGGAGNSLNATQGIQVTVAKSGANGTSKYGFTDVEQVIVLYSTNASSGAGEIAVQVGNGAEKTTSVSSTGGTTDRELKFNYSPKESGKVKVTVNCTTNSIYVKSVTVKAADIDLPVAYSITCATSLSHGSVSVTGNATTAYAGDVVTISANPDSGYQLEEWDVYKTGDSGTKVTVTNNSFTMPAYDVTVSAVFSENNNGPVTVSMNSFDATSGSVDGDSNVSYEALKGDAANAPAVNSNEIRIYQNGGLLTITGNNGKKLTSITIGSSMATKVQVKIDSGSYGSDNSISAGGTYSTGTINASTVTFKCTGTDKNSRLYLNYLSVTYN